MMKPHAVCVLTLSRKSIGHEGKQTMNDYKRWTIGVVSAMAVGLVGMVALVIAAGCGGDRTAAGWESGQGCEAGPWQNYRSCRQHNTRECCDEYFSPDPSDVEESDDPPTDSRTPSLQEEADSIQDPGDTVLTPPDDCFAGPWNGVVECRQYHRENGSVNGRNCCRYYFQWAPAPSRGPRAWESWQEWDDLVLRALDGHPEFVDSCWATGVPSPPAGPYLHDGSCADTIAAWETECSEWCDTINWWPVRDHCRDRIAGASTQYLVEVCGAEAAP